MLVDNTRVAYQRAAAVCPAVGALQNRHLALDEIHVIVMSGESSVAPC